MEDIKYWLWLSSVDEVGPVRARALLEKFGGPEAVWSAGLKQLSWVDGIGEKVAEKIMASKNDDILNKSIEKVKKYNAKIVTLYNSNYPELLKNTHSAPILLYMNGELVRNEATVSVVGSRNATQYGLRTAYNLAFQLARKGITVVSGMARGIDTAAHKGALDAGGRTIAVLGCGLDIVYPYENKDLMNRIINSGAVVTEYPIGTAPDAKHFPRRNRIISGISLGVLLVEASQKSGSLITADFALEQNREVFAVPGQIGIKSSSGTNGLIKQGAKMVTCIEDILEELNVKSYECVHDNEDQIEKLNLNDDEKIIYSNLSNIPIHLESLMKTSGFSISKLNIIFTMLELKDLIKQLPGKQFIRS
ncbi:MAG TPA: DNA-protecting protein DprA [Lachnospiraceae bacterium]|nr:DNA-protecting protein DprA [Lachnospiraceae bacterium]